MPEAMDAKIVSLEHFRAAKKANDPDRLAHAIMERAEADGQSVTEWLADHSAECTCKGGDEECPKETEK